MATIEEMNAVTHDVLSLKDDRKYVECIERIDDSAKETSDPELSAILLLAKSNCALHLRDVAMANDALSKIQVASLSEVILLSVNLMKATVAHESGRFVEADEIFSVMLASKEIREEEQRDELYGALAGRGFARAELKQFGVALEFLGMARTITDDGDLAEDISIYEGYCLQGLGRLDEAEKSAKHALTVGTGKSKADAYYRLGDPTPKK